MSQLKTKLIISGNNVYDHILIQNPQILYRVLLFDAE